MDDLHIEWLKDFRVKHKIINHTELFVQGDTHRNNIESQWNRLKFHLKFVSKINKIHNINSFQNFIDS